MLHKFTIISFIHHAPFLIPKYFLTTIKATKVIHAMAWHFPPKIPKKNIIKIFTYSLHSIQNVTENREQFNSYTCNNFYFTFSFCPFCLKTVKNVMKIFRCLREWRRKATIKYCKVVYGTEKKKASEGRKKKNVNVVCMCC